VSVVTSVGVLPPAASMQCGRSGDVNKHLGNILKTFFAAGATQKTFQYCFQSVY
jgi:hypothetical protein